MAGGKAMEKLRKKIQQLSFGKKSIPRSDRDIKQPCAYCHKECGSLTEKLKHQPECEMNKGPPKKQQEKKTKKKNKNKPGKTNN